MKVPQKASKLICAVNGVDDIILILEDKVLRATGSEHIEEMDKKGDIGGFNLNCSGISSNGCVYFLSDFKPMRYSLANGKIEQVV